jgi:TP901 family phage tail tape measure protein
MRIGDVYLRVLGDTKAVEKDIEGVGKSPAVARGGTRAGQVFSNGIRQAMTGLGTVVGATFAEGIDSAAQFKDQIATIETVAGRGAVALNGLDKGALQLSKDTGKPIEDITQGMYDLVSAGVPANKVMEVLAASSNLAIGGLGTTADAVDAVTTAMNSYGQGTYSAAQITDVFAQAVASGKVTTAQIGSTLANVAPVAAQAGIGIEEIGAAYAVMTAKGFKAEQVTTDMQQAIVALISPNEALNRVQARTGINFAKLAREKGLAVALQKLREVTGATGTTFSKFAKALTEAKPGEISAVVDKFRGTLKLTKAQAEEFKKAVGKEGMGQALSDLARKVGAGDAAFADSLGRVQAYQFALATTGDSAGEFGTQVDLASKQLTTGGLAAEQAGIKMDSPVEAGKRMAAQFKALQIETLAPFADSLGPPIVAVNQMGGALSALIKPATLIGGGLGRLASILITSILGLVAPAAVAGEAVGAATAGGISLGALLLPALLIAAVVAAIVAIVNDPSLVGKALDVGAKIIGAIVSGVAAFAGKIGDRIREIAGNLGKWFGPGVTSVVTLILGIPGKAIGWVAGLAGQALGAAAGMVGGIVEGVGHIVGEILGIPARVIGWAGQLQLQAASLAGQLLGAIVGAAANIVGTILGIPGRVVGWIGGIVSQGLQAAGGMVTGVAGGAVNVVGTILSIPARVIGWVPQIVGQAVGLAGQVVGAIAGLAGQVVGTVLSIPGRVIAWVASVVGQARQLATRVAAGIGEMAGKVVGFFLSIPGKVIGVGAKIVGGLIDGLASFPGKLWDIITSAFRNLKIDVGPFHITGAGVTIDLPHIELPHFAAGGSYPGGGQLAFVGEHGTELFASEDAGRIYSAAETQSMLEPGPAAGGGAGGPLVGSMTINNPVPEPASVSVPKALRRVQVLAQLG